MTWRGIVTVLLLIGGVISAWSLWVQRGEDATMVATSSRPDYVLNDFELIVLGAQGAESFTLRAPLLARNPATRALDVTTPLFLIPPGPGSSSDAWEVRARTGWVSAEGDELRLRGQVRAVSDGSTGVPISIATEQLNVFPEDNRVSSAVAVNINRPGSILRGHGLEVDLDTKLYTLKSEVRSNYASTR
ncbi:MAG TPA: LPS export ABC transporter periplasmic protein LptC [Lysobacter sp.]|nr:LPS export ABC transporter periplasmic protein LptC [Lysobacter sp.]